MLPESSTNYQTKALEKHHKHFESNYRLEIIFKRETVIYSIGPRSIFLKIRSEITLKISYEFFYYLSDIFFKIEPIIFRTQTGILYLNLAGE